LIEILRRYKLAAAFFGQIVEFETRALEQGEVVA
jgi:hypothetical protein